MDIINDEKQNMKAKYICEERDGKFWVRGKCCVDSDGNLREDYTGWFVKELDVPTPGVLCDEEGRFIWEVQPDDTVVKGLSSLTAKELAAIEEAATKDPDVLLQRIVDLEGRLKDLEGAK